jgi:hypothetical protein
VRSSFNSIGVLLLPLALLLVPAAACAGPASEADMSLYTRIGALNVCIARAADITFDQAVAVAGETIAQVIQGQHDGAIAQVGERALTIEELRNGRLTLLCSERWRFALRRCLQRFAPRLSRC